MPGTSSITRDFHSKTAQSLAFEVAEGTLSSSEYYRRTLCIMMEIYVDTDQISVLPVVIAVLPDCRLWSELEGMMRDLRGELFDEQDGIGNLGEPVLEVRWKNSGTPDGIAATTRVQQGNANAVLRYLKERGSVGSIFLRW